MTKDCTKELWLNRVEDDIIFIHGDFEQDINARVLPALLKLIAKEQDKKSGKIIIDIDSNGGYTDVLKILLTHVEKAKSLGIIVETRCFSKAYSCGSMLAASGTKGHRLIGEHAEHLCHLGRGGFIAETDKQLDRQAQKLKRHFNFVRSLYKKYAAIPNLDEVIADDSYFISGKQIIDFGLADKFYIEQPEIVVKINKIKENSKDKKDFPNKKTIKSFNEVKKGDYLDSSLEDFKKSLKI